MPSALIPIAWLLLEVYPAGLYREGYELIEQGHYRRAERTLNRAARFMGHGHPLHGYVEYALSVVNQETGNLARAEQYARNSLEGTTGESARAQFTANLGTVVARRGRAQEAEDLFREGLKNSGHPALHASYAALLLRERRYVEAARHIGRALENLRNGIPLDRAAALLLEAMCHHRLGAAHAATEALAEARRLTETAGGARHPLMAHVWWLESELLRAAGERKRARQALARAEEIRDAVARENLLGHTVDFQTLRR